ncbi:DinB family protein [Flagellimonas nanhaiensis]|uniref:Damage-inducible protein DinB n=1 Tax=Flagellimonas nanhaiensis TaxID=2292706 RepID=A0A371JR64_9FLAO|nr:DinB family protein [Allomuricauda nanhaiensis]RDY59997.1 damage-inducible protein DinB [Allomuricauda nanhaiensis]
MKGFLQQLFDYNFFCNKKLIEQSIALKEVPQESQKLFSHILNAHHIWNHRILEEDSKFGVWQEHDLDTWQDLHYDNQRTSFEIITNTEDFGKRIAYENSEGRAHANELKDILVHIVNHSTHHRGQILTNFRESGIVPEPLDYIFYKR